jgi:arylsulfatase A-like enzyme
LVDFSDVMPTLLELAGTPPQTALDGMSFASVLRGEAASSREWVHSFFKGEWFVRDARWKLRENGDLYNVSASPGQETRVDPSSDTDASRAARSRLQAIAAALHHANSPGR